MQVTTSSPMKIRFWGVSEIWPTSTSGSSVGVSFSFLSRTSFAKLILHLDVVSLQKIRYCKGTPPLQLYGLNNSQLAVAGAGATFGVYLAPLESVIYRVSD